MQRSRELDERYLGLVDDDERTDLELRQLCGKFAAERACSVCDQDSRVRDVMREIIVSDRDDLAIK